MKWPYRFKIGLIIILIVVFFLLLNLTLIGEEVKGFFYTISSPIQKTFWQAGEKTSDFFEAIFEAQNFKQENEELKLKIQALEAENVALEELKKENNFLREALDIGLEKEFKLVLAQITGKDIFQDFILIDKGTNDGILEGLPVITQQKVLVGKIDKVYNSSSKVILISHPSSSFDGKILDSDVLGQVKGEGSFKISIEFLPKDKEIREGALVVTSSLGGIFPAGLLVGKIRQVIKSDVEPFQKAKLEPSFNIQDLEKLFIIK